MARASRMLAVEHSLAEELEFVKNHDVPAAGQEWHLIESAWLRKWGKYVNKMGPHPGLICNMQLLDPHTDFRAPRSGLMAKKDYRGVSEAAWLLLQENYGGGPNITSTSLNIYTAIVHPPATATVAACVGGAAEEASGAAKDDQAAALSGDGSSSCSTEYIPWRRESKSTSGTAPDHAVPDHASAGTSSAPLTRMTNSGPSVVSSTARRFQPHSWPLSGLWSGHGFSGSSSQEGVPKRKKSHGSESQQRSASRMRRNQEGFVKLTRGFSNNVRDGVKAFNNLRVTQVGMPGLERFRPRDSLRA